MQHIKSLIPKVLGRRGLKDQAAASHIVYCAKKWLKKHHPILNEQYTVVTFAEAELCIRVENSIVAQEMAQLAELLKKHLNAISDITVESIRIIRK